MSLYFDQSYVCSAVLRVIWAKVITDLGMYKKNTFMQILIYQSWNRTWTGEESTGVDIVLPTAFTVGEDNVLPGLFINSTFSPSWYLI